MPCLKMAVFGKIGEFKPETEGMAANLEWVQLYFVANNVKAEAHVAVFLSVVGSKTHAVLRDLVMPAKPQDTTTDADVVRAKTGCDS